MTRFEVGKTYVASSRHKCTVTRINGENITFEIPGYGKKRTKKYVFKDSEQVEVAINSRYKVLVIATNQYLG